MRIRIRTSKLSTWARVLGLIALSSFIFAIFLHREQTITSETFHLIFLIISTIALLALLLGLAAYIQLWFSGDKGWKRASIGTIAGIICLTPLIYGAVEAKKYPNISDVSTNTSINISLISTIAKKKNIKAISQNELLIIFPNLIDRNYPLNNEIVFTLVEKLIIKNGWKIINKQAPNEIKPIGQINALEKTLFGWQDEIAILITANDEGSTISMRSTSLVAENDLGANGKRIEIFLLDLDESINKYSSKTLTLEPAATPAIITGN